MLDDPSVGRIRQPTNTHAIQEHKGTQRKCVLRASRAAPVADLVVASDRPDRSARQLIARARDRRHTWPPQADGNRKQV